ncbi:Superoxide dismutase [Corynebacterium kutscheri]|uniref:Superoxide dismutase [Cu-Zn] n=1 Tax=Corynebacterium kutscheri TaxID=35755 RepID=A0A0F6R348_9CORY|nr:superoxide dismutase family protein [Corynebacterium kutscheri]AKE42033.1 Cu/Zn superoxide dismutase [Corynebacterium kutscheri]VEH06123.1 Superoxide dismutase [Corynebacterium kutscheri]VEH10374.1 Superoxide dismutase [Corynebacterium kutscheri]VEH82037.1 Superoxide dismutase [Corynebacterium kutscheri]
MSLTLTLRTAVALVGVSSIAVLSACSNSTTTEVAEDKAMTPTATNSHAFATAELKNQSGEGVGTVEFTETDAGTKITVAAKGLTPGFHGFHIHSKAVCEGDFKSAGGHLHGMNQPHGDGYHPHAGDLPSLLINADGTGHLEVITDAVDEQLLFGTEGTALIVHEGRDNYANIPKRYAPDGPDEETLKTGDAGARIACGVISKK